MYHVISTFKGNKQINKGKIILIIFGYWSVKQRVLSVFYFFARKHAPNYPQLISTFVQSKQHRHQTSLSLTHSLSFWVFSVFKLWIYGGFPHISVLLTSPLKSSTVLLLDPLYHVSQPDCQLTTGMLIVRMMDRLGAILIQSQTFFYIIISVCMFVCIYDTLLSVLKL